MPGQMGQQMGKEAEPPLICSTKNPESDHTQSWEEGGRQTQSKREADCTLVLIFLLHSVATILFTFIPNKEGQEV